jgi:hypothetical protein
MAARPNQRGDAKVSCSSVEEDAGRDEADSKPSLVTGNSALIGSYPDQDVVQEESTPREIPSGRLDT